MKVFFWYKSETLDVFDVLNYYLRVFLLDPHNMLVLELIIPAKPLPDCTSAGPMCSSIHEPSV